MVHLWLEQLKNLNYNYIMGLPSISVVMPVFNDEKYLKESIESILLQTYENYEFIIVNDGSTDSSEKIIENYQKQDDRIILLTQDNQGITKSLNRGIKNSKGKYIARMDADDICDSKRFEFQIEYLEKNPNTDIVGSMVSKISEKGEVIQSLNDLPIEDYQIKWHLIFGTPLIHPALMIRKCVFINNGYYSDRLNFAQDIEFWRRTSSHVRFYNVPKILFKLRIHNQSTSSMFQNEQNNVREKSLVYYINSLTGMNYNKKKIALLIKMKKSGLHTFSQFNFFVNILCRLRIVFLNKKCQSELEKRYINERLSSLFLHSSLNTIRRNIFVSILLIFSSILINYRIIFYKKTYWHLKQKLYNL